MQSSVLQKNYFQLLSLPVSFELDTTKLEKHYLDLQRVFHPDRYMHAAPPEQRMAMQLSAYLNQARLCLLDPVQRGKYLLKLEGVETPEEKTIDDMEFLMQQMEWREQAAQLNASAAVQNATAQQNVQQEAAVFLQKIYEVKNIFEMQFVEAYRLQQWHAAQLLLAKMQFTQKLLSEIKIA